MSITAVTCQRFGDWWRHITL